MLKTAMREVAETLLRDRRGQQPEPDAHNDELDWSMRMVRALERGDTGTMAKCTAACPRLAAIAARGRQAVRDHAVSCAKEALLHDLREAADKAKTEDDEATQHRRAGLMHRLRKLAPGRSATVTAVTGPAGQVLTDPAEMGAAMRLHWGTVFGERQPHRALLRQWIADELVGEQVPSWTVRRKDLHRAIAEAPSSSPGPDGLPLTVWKQLGPLAEEVLWEAMQVLINPAKAHLLAEDWPMFNESLLILLPKLPAGQVGTPAETRPINITNGENRILANAIRYKAEAELGKWVTEMQQGFLPGRSLLRNVVEVSQSMQEVSLNQQSGLAIFYDFQAAFPSVCHEFLLAVLEAVGVPTGFMQFVRHLYHNNRCSLVLGGERVEGFAMSSGIRQGCPLSPLIFAVSIDLLLRRARRLCPEVLIRAYADDIAMVVPRGWEQLPMLHKLMEDFALCSGLALNLQKTAVLPLELGDPEGHRERLAAAAPSWAAAPLRHKVKYLGFYLGPAAGHESFKQALGKFEERALLWGATEGGSMMAVLAYKVYIITVLLFVLQLADLPPEWPMLEQKALQKLLPGPYQWLPMEVAHDLQSLGMPMSVPDLRDMQPAIRLRVYRGLSAHPVQLPLSSMHLRLQHSIRTTDHIGRAAIWASWYGSSFVAKLLAARDEYQQHGWDVNKLEHEIAGPIPRPWPRPVAVRVQKLFQKTADKKLCEATNRRHGQLEQKLDRRLRRWRMHVLPGHRTARVIQAMARLRGKVPPRCLYGVLRAVLNGWMTGRRFGRRHGEGAGCRLGCQGDDSIEHYSSCPVAAPLASSWLGLARSSTPEDRLADLLLVSRFASPDELRRRALWTGSLYQWHNLCRHAVGLTTVQRRLEALAHCLRDSIAGTCTTTSTPAAARRS